MSDHVMVLTLVAFGVAFANIAMLSYLTKTYLDLYKQARSPFTRGLLFFPSFLLIQQLGLVIVLVHLNLEQGWNDGGLLSLLNLFEAVGLLFLVRTSRA